MSPDLPIRTRQRLEAAQQAAENKRQAAQRPGQLERDLMPTIYRKPEWRAPTFAGWCLALVSWLAVLGFSLIIIWSFFS